jgi:hypothetical protein
MTAADAISYAEMQYNIAIAPYAIASEQTMKLVKERLAHAYLDGGLAVAGSLFPREPITATVNQPESKERS